MHVDRQPVPGSSAARVGWPCAGLFLALVCFSLQASAQPAGPASDSAPAVVADPQVPICDGAQEQLAQESAKAGKELYRAAVKTQPANQTKLAEALAQFDQQCAAGDDWALELRASTLILMNRPLEAARNLDAFLAAHPFATLPADGKLRVSENRTIIYDKVGTLLIKTNAHQPELTLDGAPAAPLASPLRVLPGAHSLRLGARGFRPAERTVEVQAGASVELEMRLEMVGSSVAETNEQIPVLAAPVVQPVDQGAGRRRKLFRWAIGTGAGALVAGVVGIVGMSSAYGAVDDYDKQGCTRSDSAKCQDSEDQYHRGIALEAVGLAAAGVLAASSVTLWILHSRAGSNDKPSPRATRGCAPTFGHGLQVSCMTSF